MTDLKDLAKRLRDRHEGSMNSHGNDLRLMAEAAAVIEATRAAIASVKGQP